jgi:hypothetical protein
LRAIGAAVLLAAGWFLGILVFVEKAFCPYCLAVHACGVAFGVAAFVLSGRDPGGEGSRGWGVPAAIGLGGIAILAFGQVLGPRPETHEIVEVGAGGKGGTARIGSGAKGREARRVEFVNGRVLMSTDQTPVLGDPSAPHAGAEFFDYTCVSCREMHGDLKLLMKKHPGSFLILLVPTPLNVRCNPAFSGDPKDHAEACEFARLALALWQAAPEKFPEFHEYLMTGERPPPLSDARARAEEIVGEDVLEKIWEDEGWFEKRFAQTSALYRFLSSRNDVMPKLLLGGASMLNGTAKDPETFVEIMEKQFGLAAAPGGK